MGINLWDGYYESMRKRLITLTIEEYYEERDRLLTTVRKICPHDLIHPRINHPRNDTEKEVLDWCEENLRGQYFTSMEVEKHCGEEKECIVCFEFEEDAMAFKLAWG